MKAETKERAAQAAPEFAFATEAHALEVSTTYPLSEPALDSRSRLGRYALIQLQDFLAKQGVMMAVLAAALAIPMAMALRESPLPYATIVNRIFGVVTAALVGFGPLLAVRGVVSDDTQHGWHRFLFSKPLDVARYYLQSYAVRFAGFMAMLAVLLLPFAFLGAVGYLPALAIGALVFSLVASMSFLISTVSRLDTGLVLAIGAVTTLVQGVSRTPLFAWLRPLAWILPPLDRLSEVINYLLRGSAITDLTMWGYAAWIVAYGAACVAGGLAILKRRAVSA